jgi:hypothetical protein
MTNETSVLPELSARFASRVLEEADRVQERRQRVRRALAAGAGVVSLVVAGALGVRTLDRGPPMPPRAPIAVADAQPLGPESGNQADALDDLFPDAAPVERFDRTYMSGSPGADDLLAEDTVDDDGGGL